MLRLIPLFILYNGATIECSVVGVLSIFPEAVGFENGTTHTPSGSVDGVPGIKRISFKHTNLGPSAYQSSNTPVRRPAATT